jgi:hypothetical protein
MTSWTFSLLSIAAALNTTLAVTHFVETVTGEFV